MSQLPEKNSVNTRRRAVAWTLLVGVVFLIAAAAWIKVCGCRATSQPSSFERTIARGLRNFAIPRAGSHRPNPYANDARALQQGRDLFLSRCASCHGTDGRGMTPIGANIYPRVPDLQANRTQELSDGQNHYIIENGVQLTGMPATIPRTTCSVPPDRPAMAAIPSTMTSTRKRLRNGMSAVNAATDPVANTSLIRRG